jgi:hypothetical protein
LEFTVDTSVSRRWLIANVLGMLIGLPLWGFVADGIVDIEGPLNIPMHFVSAVAFAAVLSLLQRRAIGATRTPYVFWVAAQAVVMFLAFGLGFDLIGPPADFIAGMVGLGAVTGYLLRREAKSAGSAHPRWLVAKGALAGLASVAGMVPVFLVADRIDDALGGGVPPFLVILALIGTVSGLALGALLRPGGASALVPASQH